MLTTKLEKKRIFGFAFLSAFAFVFIVQNTTSGGFLRQVDLEIALTMPQFWNPFSNMVMLGITSIMSPKILPIFLLFLLAFIYKKQRQNFLATCIAIIGAIVSGYLLKIFFHVPRPVGALVSETSFSFPSAHATMATVFFLLLFLVLKVYLPERVQRNLLGVIIFLCIFSVGASRIYLGVHWLSDVLGGLALGIFWVFLPLFSTNFPSKMPRQ